VGEGCCGDVGAEFLDVVSLSSLRSSDLADLVYSIVQAKVSPYFLFGEDFFLAFADALRDFCGEVVVLDVINASFDHLADVEGFRAAGL